MTTGLGLKGGIMKIAIIEWVGVIVLGLILGAMFGWGF
jgi:hypothetical protein